MDPAAPDWITQVRRLPSKHAHEEIVINRDKDSEKVVTRQPTSEEDRLERGESENGSRTIADASASGGRSYEETANGERERTLEVTETDLGDGDHEWREGKDLVIEHRRNSSDEVSLPPFPLYVAMSLIYGALT